jgi:hypothetical protein
MQNPHAGRVAALPTNLEMSPRELEALTLQVSAEIFYSSA